MAKELATRTSLEIVALERGPARNPVDYITGMDELDYGVHNRMMQNPASITVFAGPAGLNTGLDQVNVSMTAEGVAASPVEISIQ